MKSVVRYATQDYFPYNVIVSRYASRAAALKPFYKVIVPRASTDARVALNGKENGVHSNAIYCLASSTIDTLSALVVINGPRTPDGSAERLCPDYLRGQGIRILLHLRESRYKYMIFFHREQYIVLVMADQAHILEVQLTLHQ